MFLLRNLPWFFECISRLDFRILHYFHAGFIAFLVLCRALPTCLWLKFCICLSRINLLIFCCCFFFFIKLHLPEGCFQGCRVQQELGLMWPQINTCSVLKSCFNCLCCGCCCCCTLEVVFILWPDGGVKGLVKSSSQGWNYWLGT